MKEEKKITQADIDGAQVKLRNIGGIQPRIYLPILYSLGLLLILFLLFILPGIRKFGSYLELEGNPTSAAVYVNDSYKGSSQQRIYIPAGSYSIRIEREGFIPETRELQVSGRLAGSLFFPKIQKLEYSLELDDADSSLTKAFADYSSWSLSGKPSALYQIPTLLSERVADMAAAGAFLIASKSPSSLAFAQDCLSATASAESGRDALRASTLFASRGIIGPLSLAHSARTLVAALGEGSQGWTFIKDLSPSLSRKSNHIADGQKPAATGAKAPLATGRLQAAGFQFILFSPGSLIMGGEAPSGSLLPYSTSIQGFGLAATEVSNRQWAEFMDSNPEWHTEAREELMLKGLVDDNYLAEWKGPNELPVTGVSWYAASAYCDWLSTRMGSAYKAVLPSEAMWEAAARAGLSDSGSLYEKRAVWSDGTRSGPARAASMGSDASGLADLFGNVWEWSQDSYRPYPAFAAGTFSTAERTVRGGSWANAAGSISINSRGGMEPSASSPFLGFRPALLSR